MYKAIVDNVAFYQYPTFSKDSVFTRKYGDMDTALKHAGWGGVSTNKKHILDEKINDIKTNLTDTLIDGILYMREKKYTVIKQVDTIYHSQSISYYRCDTEDWMFYFVNNKNEKGCIFSRVDWQVGNQEWMSAQYEFIKGLTKEQEEVFKSWEHNAIFNPITKL